MKLFFSGKARIHRTHAQDAGILGQTSYISYKRKSLIAQSDAVNITRWIPVTEEREVRDVDVCLER